jgi:Uma2 family endonuclease
MTALTHLLYVKDLLFEPGDRMGREEFLSRWERMPELKFAELIDGVVYLPSPTSAGHSRKHGVLLAWTAVYAGRAAFVEILPEATWFMEESAPQPDVALRIKPDFGGQSRDAGKYVAGAPEFVAEVCGSRRSYDLGPKLELYERAGVCEYLAVLLEERRLEWRMLRAGAFQLTTPDDDGVFRSSVLPGLWLDEPAFWRDDIPAVLPRLEQGLTSGEFLLFQQAHTRR